MDGFEFFVCYEIEIKGDYIKAANIIQNFNGQVFCVPFLRDGQFNVVIFNTKRMLKMINLSEHLGINSYIRPNDNMPYPMMDACFVDKLKVHDEMPHFQRFEQEQLFVNMFVPKTQKVISLKICYKSGIILTSPIETEIEHQEGGHTNFPISTLYDENRFHMHIVFR